MPINLLCMRNATRMHFELLSLCPQRIFCTDNVPTKLNIYIKLKERIIFRSSHIECIIISFSRWSIYSSCVSVCVWVLFSSFLYDAGIFAFSCLLSGVCLICLNANNFLHIYKQTAAAAGRRYSPPAVSVYAAICKH